MSDKKREVSFLDDNNIKWKLECEITHRNGYPEFTMSGDGNGSGGQCVDSISAANDEQSQLIDIWNKWHLNGMNTGTEKQQKFIDKLNIKYDYTKICTILKSTNSKGKNLNIVEYNEFCEKEDKLKSRIKNAKNELLEITTDLKDQKNSNSSWLIWKHKDSIFKPEQITNHKAIGDRLGVYLDNRYKLDSLIKQTKAGYDSIIEKVERELEKHCLQVMLYDKHPETGKLYEYGCGWINRSLPETLWNEVDELCDEIESLEEERKGELTISDAYDTGDERLEEYDDSIIALGIHLELSMSEIDDIKTSNYGYGNGIHYTVQGTDYYSGNKDEITDAEYEYVEQTIKECYLHEVPENVRTYIDMEKWTNDWCGNWSENLNGYDGNGYEVKVNNTTYYICRT